MVAAAEEDEEPVVGAGVGVDGAGVEAPELLEEEADEAPEEADEAPEEADEAPEEADEALEEAVVDPLPLVDPLEADAVKQDESGEDWIVST